MKTLILHEQDRQSVTQIERDSEGLSSIDIAAFAFDSSSLDSFQEAHDMLLRTAHASGNLLPCVLVAVENDTGMQEVGYLYLLSHAHSALLHNFTVWMAPITC